MSATTTDPRIDVAPGPGVVHTAKDIEEEIMREWDGVDHFYTEPEPGLGAIGIVTVNCGAETINLDASDWLPGETKESNDCPLCQAIHDEICARNP